MHDRSQSVQFQRDLGATPPLPQYNPEPTSSSPLIVFSTYLTSNIAKTLNYLGFAASRKIPALEKLEANSSPYGCLKLGAQPIRYIYIPTGSSTGAFAGI